MVAGDVVVRDAALTRVDEAALLAEIGAEFTAWPIAIATAEASAAAPLLAAVEAIYPALARGRDPARHARSRSCP
jgi:hypothetical protein